jgi:carbonic anhydrase
VVTCDDPSLTPRLEPALGLKPGEATVVRLPGGGGALSVDLLQRCVAKAVLVDGCDEVLVLAHSGCSLGNISASALVEAMSRHQIPRSAVPGDLRDLVGAGRDPKEAAREAAAALRSCAFLPARVPVHLAVLDDDSGQLTVIEHGEQLLQERSPVMVANVAGYQPGPMPAHEATGAPLPELGSALPPAGMDLPLAAPPQQEPPAFQPGPVLQAAPVLQATPVLSASSDLPPFILQGPAAPARQPPPPPLPAPPAPSPPMASRRPSKPQRRPGTGAPRPAHGKDLTDAVEKLRDFIRSEIRPPERRELREEFAQASAAGAGTEELVKITLAPILKAGQNRYRVIDEMILLKEKALAMPPDLASALLRSILT